jgi:lysyl-tRNA synthetase class 2
VERRGHPEKQGGGFSEAEATQLGIRADLFPILQKMGIQSVEQLKAYKASKLFNDVCGLRKKMKLENVQNPTQEEVEGWLK